MSLQSPAKEKTLSPEAGGKPVREGRGQVGQRGPQEFEVQVPSPLGSASLLGQCFPRWVFTWIFPSSPVLSIRLATLTVFPQMSY